MKTQGLDLECFCTRREETSFEARIRELGAMRASARAEVPQENSRMCVCLGVLPHLPRRQQADTPGAAHDPQ